MLSVSLQNEVQLRSDREVGLCRELFVLPFRHDAYLVYAPLHKAAFVGNAAAVNRLPPRLGYRLATGTA
jgi:hypothetical protein